MSRLARYFLGPLRIARAHPGRAEMVLEEAYNMLQERAAKIDDEELRRSYLENVAAHREILCEWRSAKRTT